MLVALALVAGCASDDAPVYIERPVEDLYNQAMDNLAVGSYKEAYELFEEVDRQHPYSAWAARAQLMGAYVYYLSNRFDEAILALDRFIDLHPGHDNIDYAYYLKAICYYDRIVDVGRDQEITRQALESFREILRRFPNSAYARDSSLKLDLTMDHLAGKEMYVGRFYLRREETLAAINRFRQVLVNYQTTTHTPEALYRLVEAYSRLGIEQEAQRAAAVLGHNFPGNIWYDKAYALIEGEGQVSGDVSSDVSSDVPEGSWWRNLLDNWL